MLLTVIFDQNGVIVASVKEKCSFQHDSPVTLKKDENEFLSNASQIFIINYN